MVMPPFLRTRVARPVLCARARGRRGEREREELVKVCEGGVGPCMKGGEVGRERLLAGVRGCGTRQGASSVSPLIGLRARQGERGKEGGKEPATHGLKRRYWLARTPTQAGQKARGRWHQTRGRARRGRIGGRRGRGASAGPGRRCGPCVRARERGRVSAGALGRREGRVDARVAMQTVRQSGLNSEEDRERSQQAGLVCVKGSGKGACVRRRRAR